MLYHGRAVVAHACNPSTLGGRGRRISECEASLVYRVRSSDLPSELWCLLLVSSFCVYMQFLKDRTTKDALIGTESSVQPPSSGLNRLCQQVKEGRLKSLPMDFHAAYTAGSTCFLV